MPFGVLAPGVDSGSVERAQAELTRAGAKVRLLAARLGPVENGGGPLEPDATLETMPSVLFDAVVVPDGSEGAKALAELGHVAEFLKDQYRHCKPILMLGAGRTVVEGAGILVGKGEDWGLTCDVKSFVKALGRHRNWDRQTDPPMV